MLRFILLLAISLYLLSTLFPKLDLSLILSILCIAIVFSTLFLAKRFVQILGVCFLLFGVTLLIKSNSPLLDYILAFGPMLDLLTMFTLIPILGIPIKLGEYSRSIQVIIRKNVKTSGHLYIITSGISYFFSIFMNLATLPMTYYSIRPALNVFPVQHKERFMTRAISRGFAMPLLWAPVTPIVGIVITMTGVSWISILPYVVPLSILGMLLDWYIGTRKAKKSFSIPIREETAASLEQSEFDRPFRVFHILIAIIIFNILISVVEVSLSYPFLILVSVLVIPFSFTWCILLRKGKEYGVHLVNHFQSFAITMKDQFFIFLCAGFFISAINISQTNDLLNVWVLSFIDAAGIQIFLFLIPLIPVALAFLGLHPAVSLALMVEGINPEAIGIAPHILTVAMLAGAVSSFLVGPYNATLGLMSNIIKESSYQVSNWNLSFAALYIGCVMVYLLLLEMLLF